MRATTAAWRGGITPGALALLAVAIGCSHFPRYDDTRPAPAPPRALAAGEAEAVTLTVATRANVTWGKTGADVQVGPLTVASEPLMHFSLRLHEVLPVRDAAPGRHLADVRSADIPLTMAQYRELRCGWAGRDGCHTALNDGTSARVVSEPLVGDALGQLQVQAARLRADAVHRVRCFVKHTPLRLWCEGAAYTGEAGGARLSER